MWGLGEGWPFSYLFFWRLIILHSKITLLFGKLCYAFEKYFSATIILWKKVILSSLKMNMEISHKLIYLICEGICILKRVGWNPFTNMTSVTIICIDAGCKSSPGGIFLIADSLFDILYLGRDSLLKYMCCYFLLFLVQLLASFLYVCMCVST